MVAVVVVVVVGLLVIVCVWVVVAKVRDVTNVDVFVVVAAYGAIPRYVEQKGWAARKTRIASGNSVKQHGGGAWVRRSVTTFSAIKWMTTLFHGPLQLPGAAIAT